MRASRSWLERQQEANHAKKDVAARLKVLGWPVRFWQDDDLLVRLSAISADNKSEPMGEGILSADRLTGHELRPLWTVSTAFVRTQTFPPGKAVTRARL